MTPKSKNGWTARKRTTTLRERCNNCTRESLGLPSSCRDACFCRLLGLLDLLLGPVELDLGPVDLLFGPLDLCFPLLRCLGVVGLHGIFPLCPHELQSADGNVAKLSGCGKILPQVKGSEQSTSATTGATSCLAPSTGSAVAGGGLLLDIPPSRHSKRTKLTMGTWPQEMGPGFWERSGGAHTLAEAALQNRSSCNPPKPKKQTPHPKPCLSICLKMSKAKIAMSTWPQERARGSRAKSSQHAHSLSFTFSRGFLGRSRHKTAHKKCPSLGFTFL